MNSPQQEENNSPTLRARDRLISGEVKLSKLGRAMYIYWHAFWEILPHAHIFTGAMASLALVFYFKYDNLVAGLVLFVCWVVAIPWPARRIVREVEQYRKKNITGGNDEA